MASFARLLVLLLILVALAGDPMGGHALAAELSLPAAVSALADDREWAERHADHLVVRYAPETESEVGWYAEFAETSYRQVAEIFGVERKQLTLVVFPDEEAYIKVNPLAARADGVLGHARPSTNEIGLALTRLREQTEGLRRDTIRHEITHIVLGELSDQRLPIGFQEGIAQYLETDPEGRERTARGLRRGIDEGQMLSLTDLNRPRTFMARAWYSYPQSYSFVAFLAERYGFGSVVALVKATREAETLDDATRRAYDRPLAELQTEWQASLPQFLDGGYARNELDIWEMAEPRQKFSEARYAESREGFERAARLFEGLGRAERLDQARDGQRLATYGIEATDLSLQGAAALGGFEYDRAADLLGQAELRWAAVGDETRRARTDSALGQARTGLEAEVGLDEARVLLHDWKFTEATDRAREAGQVFVRLGDEGRTEEANQLMADAHATQTRFATYAIGAGVAGLGVAGAGWVVGRRRRSAPTASLPGPAARGWSL